MLNAFGASSKGLALVLAHLVLPSFWSCKPERAARTPSVAESASEHRAKGERKKHKKKHERHAKVDTAQAAQPAPPPAPAQPGDAAALGGPSFVVGNTVTFHGACDASGAVSLDRASFVVADDEDNFLRIYNAEKGGAPLRALNVSPELGLQKRHPESDLEAATRLGDTVYWLTSHARNKKGKLKPERQFFFGTSVPNLDDPLKFIGEPYRGLQDDLIAAPAFGSLGLQQAAELAPKESGGFNLEGMTATPDDAMLLGLRNPVPDGLAVLAILRNPREVLWGSKPDFADPIRLDLNGLGVRGLSWWHGQYLILAGPRAEGPSRLFTWMGPGHVARPSADDLSAINPEGFFTPEDRDEILLLSDDGTRPIDGVECKLLTDPAQKRFRGVWIKPY